MSASCARLRSNTALFSVSVLLGPRWPAIVEAAMAQADDETEETDGDNEGDAPDEPAPTFDDVI